jgi:DNA-binding NarL/FixJ family response regulator
VDEAPTLAEACDKLVRFGPELIVLDLGLPDTTGTEGVKRMLQLAPGVPILVLSFNVEAAYAAQLLKMGVAGYLPKDRAGDDLVTALRCIGEGRKYVTEEAANHLVDLLGGRTQACDPHELLSTQETRVMMLIAAGKTPAEMALLMNLSVKTIGTYRARLLEKTGWKNNTELTKYCVARGLTDAV